MRKFLSNQVIKDIPLPPPFHETCEPLQMKLSAEQSGTLQQLFPDHCLPSKTIQGSLLSIGPVYRGDHWGDTDSYYICCGPYSRDSLGAANLVNLRKSYAGISGGLREVSITTHLDRFACRRLYGDQLRSTNSTGDRSAFILARCCTLWGSIDIS